MESASKTDQNDLNKKKSSSPPFNIDHNCQSSKEKDLFSTNPRLTAQRRRRRLLPACISTWSSSILSCDHTSGCDYDDDDNNDDDDDDYDNDDTSIAGPSTDLRLASKL